MRCQLLLGALMGIVATQVGPAWSQSPQSKSINVLKPSKLSAAPIAAVRTPLGISNDYKPFMTQLKSGDLLIVAFCFGKIGGVDGYAERAVFWR
ncbi:MAG: hypothetical protein QF805_09825, partial [Pirellulaceae bacterium]|nr:hypothetical protein [Pirellulaceae bacterium]